MAAIATTSADSLTTIGQVTSGVLDALSGGQIIINDAASSGGKVLEPEDGWEMTRGQANTFLLMNLLFGILFVICFASTIAVIVRRDIADVFLKHALAAMIVALGLSAIMCFILASYEVDEYMQDQTVPFQ